MEMKYYQNVFSPKFRNVFNIWTTLSIFIWQRFTQYLASSNCSFQLNNFLDKGNVAGKKFVFVYVCFFSKFFSHQKKLVRVSIMEY